VEEETNSGVEEEWLLMETAKVMLQRCDHLEEGIIKPPP
jgi:hypothetical protein